jgi:hypothetical protein
MFLIYLNWIFSSPDSLSIRSPLDVSTIELQQNTHTVESSLLDLVWSGFLPIVSGW